MLPTSSQLDANDFLIDESEEESLRAQRVWRFLKVQFATWITFAIFHTLRGYSPAALICFLETFILLAILVLRHRGSAKSYLATMHMSLVASGSGIVMLSSSHPNLVSALYFFPISIVIASQLQGVRSALNWLLVSTFAGLFFFSYNYGFISILTTQIDQFTTYICFSLCLFFFCHQGEVFYEEKTSGLQKFSKELRQKSLRLEQLATTDSLTGLSNRHHFQSELETAVNHAVETDSRMALFVIDMDGFKEVNDSLGHPIGDLALIEIANRLNKFFQQRGIVSRLGGDEFCIILPDVGKRQEAEDLASLACVELNKRYELEACDFALGGSVGVAFCPDDSRDATDLLAFADTAMFQAKNKMLGYTRYQSIMTDELIEYRGMQEKLSFALERDEFFLVYQPQLNVATGEVFGAEALLRWRHNGEVIFPDQFISILEQSREIIPVGKWVIHDGCRQLAQWVQMGMDLKISFNVSPFQFNDDDFNQSIENAIKEFNIDPCRLDFEITESVLVEDVSQAITKLNQLKDLGCSISIDDFGTGYSSLAYLRQFPLDRLKIDRAFVKDVPHADDGVIASSIIALSKAIGLKVLAEGVESLEQLTYLKSLDCDEYQGYLCSRPLLAEQFEALVVSTHPVEVTH